MMIDTGAQTSVMSLSLAKRLHLHSQIDTSTSGIASGVGQAQIVGTLRSVLVSMGGSMEVEFEMEFVVLDLGDDDDDDASPSSSSSLFLLGLDQMRKFSCVVDLQRDVLVFGGRGGLEVPFQRVEAGEMGGHSSALNTGVNANSDPISSVNANTSTNANERAQGGDTERNQEENNSNNNNNNNNNNNTRDLEQLERERLAMERLAGAILSPLLQRLTETISNSNNNPMDPPPPPPASSHAIRRLPDIVLTPDDINITSPGADTSNQQCSVCFETHVIGSRVTRLPCGHIFHRECIIPWLENERCTCPVCRYELATDDEEYERGRLERMRRGFMRSSDVTSSSSAEGMVRIRRRFLERMTARELRDLAFDRLGLEGRNERCMEKDDLIQRIVDSGRIQFVDDHHNQQQQHTNADKTQPSTASTSQPVEIALSDLRSMNVAKLKKCMNDVGVLFDPKDVVEKEDMVQIFIHSGRVVLLPESNDAPTPTTTTGNVNRSTSSKPQSTLKKEEQEDDTDLKKPSTSFADVPSDSHPSRDSLQSFINRIFGPCLA